MLKRIVAIAFIFAVAGVAWAVLGVTILARTHASHAGLRGRVESSWGSEQIQSSPTASYLELIPQTIESTEDGKKIVRRTLEKVARSLPLESSRVEAALDLEHRQKGLLWYSTYKVDFAGSYLFRNTTEQPQMVSFTLAYPARQAIYDDLTFTLDDAPASFTHTEDGATTSARLERGQTARLRVSYRSQGLSSWRYDLGGGVVQVRDLQLRMRTNFRAIDFPENTLSPTEKNQTLNGWELLWSYKNLVSGYDIGMAMPEKLQPGPLAGRISFFAPVSLFFFFFLLFMITTLRNIELHPMNYFFLAAAFFAFHLLLAYLVDHISIHLAFAICSAVSVLLVVSYLRVVVGMRFAAVEAGITQFIYLVLFSYAFFFKGFTGLTVTIGAILTLFVVMKMTARVRWSEKFATLSSRSLLSEEERGRGGQQ